MGTFNGRRYEERTTIDERDAWQHICIDCGDSQLVHTPVPIRNWVCGNCRARRLIEDKAWIDQQGIRRCHRCKKRLARLNFGPQCYACDIDGPPPEPIRGWTDIDDRTQKIIAAYKAGNSMAKVAAQFSLHEKTVWQTLKDAGVKSRPSRLGGRNRTPKEKIARVIELRAQGLSQSVIARAVGIGKSTVSEILKREREKEDK